jgi:hypothetical protein
MIVDVCGVVCDSLRFLVPLLLFYWMSSMHIWKNILPRVSVNKSINFRILDFSSFLAFFEYFNY